MILVSIAQGKATATDELLERLQEIKQARKDAEVLALARRDSLAAALQRPGKPIPPLSFIRDNP